MANNIVEIFEHRAMPAVSSQQIFPVCSIDGRFVDIGTLLSLNIRDLEENTE